MKKKAVSREKTAPIQEQDLTWVKGSSGYVVTSGRQEPTDPPPTDGEG